MTRHDHHGAALAAFTRVHWQKRVRKWHRYLGLIFGIQFLFWTIGGLYFSWTNIKTIRGDDIRNAQPVLRADIPVQSPAIAFRTLLQQHPHAELEQVQMLVNAQDRPVYLLRYLEHHTEHHLLADAITGAILSSITQDSAVAIALRAVKGKNQLAKVNLVRTTNGHHEYREKPLPAYAVTLSGEVNATVYVGKETGMVHSIRNNQWRVFDFLWMLHVMDFKTRDDINNWLLRILSVAGLITLCSGYLLFFLSKRKRKTT